MEVDHCPLADGYWEAAAESPLVCVHTHQRGGLRGGGGHVQWLFAFYLEVMTFHPQDTELSVRRRKVLLPFAFTR